LEESLAINYERGNLAEAQGYLERAEEQARRQGTALGTSEICLQAAIHLANGQGEAALAAIERELAENNEPHEGALYSILGAIHGSGLLAETQDPAPCFEQAMDLPSEKAPFP
jgi:ATP/maltotriose-dependent transcriptional regulator MalT